MSTSTFNQRVYGISIIKAINSNFNADFTRQPRTLPDGIVYATDKAYKYMIRKYIFDHYHQKKLLLWKRLNENMNPLSLEESYKNLFQNDASKEDPKQVLKNLLSCYDVRIFGATFAAKGQNFSIHGPLQISHAINRYPENEIYSEQIMSPFRNPGKESQSEKGQTTLGSQFRLREGHYVYHFSLNPFNLSTYTQMVEDLPTITKEDIKIIKETMRKCVSYFDSTSKAGSDNELLLWIELNKDSRKVFPNFIEEVNIQKNNGMVEIHLEKIFRYLKDNQNEIQSIELYIDQNQTQIPGLKEYEKELKIQIHPLFE